MVVNMVTVVVEQKQTIGLRMLKDQISRIDNLIYKNKDYYNRSSWLRAAILAKLTADEAKLRINDEK